MSKKLSVIIVSIILVISLCVSIQASESLLRWQNIFEVFGGNISFSGNSGSYYVDIIGNTGVEKITATVTLYFKNSSGNWVEIPMGWSYETESDELTINESFTGVSGRTYKAVLNATVSDNGYDEPVSKTSIVTCP